MDGTGSAPAAATQKKQRHEAKSLEKSIEKTIETLFRCSMFVDEGFPIPPAHPADHDRPQQASEAASLQRQHFHAQMNELTANLGELDAEAQKLPHLTVPLTVIERVDAGLNPDAVTQVLRILFRQIAFATIEIFIFVVVKIT
jgi:hypothetical protein